MLQGTKMDTLCDTFEKISILSPEEEYTLLRKFEQRGENLKIKETLKYIEDVYKLFNRYTTSWIDYTEELNNGIKKGVSLFIYNHDNIKNPTDLEIYFLYCIAKSTVKIIIEEVDKIREEESDDEEITRMYDHTKGYEADSDYGDDESYG